MKKFITILLAASVLVSCDMVTRVQETVAELFRGEALARVGRHRLHRSELEKYIPSGVSPEDSAAFAKQYIQTWALDLLMMEMAEKQLSPKEKDVSEELEQYRKSLIKYRYGQLYIDQRLDTLVTDSEISAFYEENRERFRLERAIFKSRYLVIQSGAKILPELKDRMSSDDPLEVMEADSLASTVAIKFADQADTWTDGLALARDVGVDYKALVASIKGSFSEVADDAGNLHVVYIAEMVPEGRTAPLEYCEDRIRDLILSSRKHNLEVNLQKDLLEDAARNNKFVIY